MASSNRSSLQIAPLALLGTTSCTWFDVRPLQLSDAGSLDSSSEHTNAICAHATPPARPGTSSDAGTLDLVFMTYAGTLGELDDDAGVGAYRSIGYDLDHTCTGQGEGPSCTALPSSLPPRPDGLDGRDNATGELAWTSTHNGSSSPTLVLAADVAKGIGVGLIRVRNYNGQADDPEVEADLYISVGLDTSSGASRPLWDGTDHWLVGADWVTSGTHDIDAPRYADHEAYVSNHTLVGHFATFKNGNPYKTALNYQSLILTAELTKSGKLWELNNGVYAAVWPVRDALAWIGQLRQSDNPDAGGLCIGTSDYVRGKAIICAYADLATTASNDPTRPCDALSAGWTFAAKQAALGRVLDVPALPVRCAPELDPRNDTCEQKP